jgi:hypothetical protein
MTGHGENRRGGAVKDRLGSAGTGALGLAAELGGHGPTRTETTWRGMDRRSRTGRTWNERSRHGNGPERRGGDRRGGLGGIGVSRRDMARRRIDRAVAVGTGIERPARVGAVGLVGRDRVRTGGRGGVWVGREG